MTDDELRIEVRKLKQEGKIKKYTDLAECIHMSPKSFSSWLNNGFNTSDWRKAELEKNIASLWES